MYKTLHGLVLREVKYKESSKILTILTEEEGKITAEARGALRKGSKCAAAAQALTWSELTFFENRGRYTLTSPRSAPILAIMRSAAIWRSCWKPCPTRTATARRCCIWD